MGLGPRGCCVQIAKGARTHPVSPPVHDKQAWAGPASTGGQDLAPVPSHRARAGTGIVSPPAQPPSPWGLFSYQPFDVQAKAGKILSFNIDFFLSGHPFR